MNAVPAGEISNILDPAIELWMGGEKQALAAPSRESVMMFWSNGSGDANEVVSELFACNF